MTQTKICGKCGGEKRLISTCQQWACDPCNRARANAYRWANIETVRAKDREREAAKPVEYKQEKKRRSRERHIDSIRAKNLERMKRKYWADPDKYRAISRERYQANAQRFREMKRKLYWSDPERYRSYARKHHDLHRDVINARDRERAAALHDSYVRELIADTSSARIPCAQIPQTLVEAKRVQLQIKRLIREKTK